VDNLGTKTKGKMHAGERFVLVNPLKRTLRCHNANICAEGLELLRPISSRHRIQYCSTDASMSLAKIVTSGAASDSESATYVKLWKFLVAAKP
jgi:hypothetical protein